MKTTWRNKKEVLVLRSCNPDRTCTYPHSDFRWPKKGPVECPDWDPEPNCGNGLHGALWGQGDGDLFCYDDGAKWLVVAVLAEDIVELGGKVKFPRGRVVHCGDRLSATAYLQKYVEAPVIGGTATAGDSGTATAGDYGTATAGDSGTATAGYRGTATAGNYGTATAGDSGTATAGDYGTATAGDSGTATAGYRGTATAGDSGTATAGDYGTATAGDSGTATAGYRGTATAGYRGTATAGDSGTATAGDYGTATAGNYGTATAGNYGTATAGNYGTVQIKYWDRESERYRVATGYIGEDGLKPDTPYRLNESFKFMEVSE